MRKADLALVAIAIVGHKKKVVSSPRRPLSAVGRRAFLQRHLPQNAPQGNNWKTLRLKFDEEDAPWLARSKWPEPLYVLDLRRTRAFDPELFGAVRESQLFKVVGVDRPV